MAYESHHPQYTVRVDGMLLAETQFVIQAEVTYAEGLTVVQREALSMSASMEILLGVMGEWERGQRLGANTVRISVVGDDDLDRFFRKWPHTLWSSVQVRTSRPDPRRSPQAPQTPHRRAEIES
jgi:hypothetical protein